MPARSAPLLLGALLLACRGSASDPGERACATACAKLAGAECEAGANPSCLGHCRDERARAKQGQCTNEYDVFLNCLGREGTRCQARAGESIVHGTALSACEEAYAEYARCALTCREHGVVRSADRSLRDGEREVRVQAEVTTQGCGRALPPMRRGAPPGSACEYQSVCEPVMCRCPAPTEGYRVRACIDGACAADDRGCRLAPLAVGHPVCRPRAKTAP